MSNSEASERSGSEFPESNQAIPDSRNAVLVIADGTPDTTIRPSRHPILREWPRPRMPKPPGQREP